MKTKLRLYSVTLPWNSRDPEQGDFSEYVWAKDDTDAIRRLALRMVDKSSDSCLSRKKMLADYVDGAGSYAAEEISLRIQADMMVLLSGPKGIMPSGAGMAYACIRDLMKIYGGGEP